MQLSSTADPYLKQHCFELGDLFHKLYFTVSWLQRFVATVYNVLSFKSLLLKLP